MFIGLIFHCNVFSRESQRPFCWQSIVVKNPNLIDISFKYCHRNVVLCVLSYGPVFQDVMQNCLLVHSGQHYHLSLSSLVSLAHGVTSPFYSKIFYAKSYSNFLHATTLKLLKLSFRQQVFTDRLNLVRLFLPRDNLKVPALGIEGSIRRCVLFPEESFIRAKIDGCAPANLPGEKRRWLDRGHETTTYMTLRFA